MSLQQRIQTESTVEKELAAVQKMLVTLRSACFQFTQLTSFPLRVESETSAMSKDLKERTDNLKKYLLSLTRYLEAHQVSHNTEATCVHLGCSNYSQGICGRKDNTFARMRSCIRSEERTSPLERPSILGFSCYRHFYSMLVSNLVHSLFLPAICTSLQKEGGGTCVEVPEAESSHSGPKVSRTALCAIPSVTGIRTCTFAV